MQIGAQGAKDKDDSQLDECHSQWPVVGLGLTHQRCDVVVDERSCE